MSRLSTNKDNYKVFYNYDSADDYFESITDLYKFYKKYSKETIKKHLSAVVLYQTKYDDLPLNSIKIDKPLSVKEKNKLIEKAIDDFGGTFTLEL